MEEVILAQDKELRENAKKGYEEMQYISSLIEDIENQGRSSKEQELELLRKFNVLEDNIRDLESRFGEAQSQLDKVKLVEMQEKIQKTAEESNLNEDIKNAILELVQNHKKRIIG